jgi:thiol-disulfide isomerase/thioredoxin
MLKNLLLCFGFIAVIVAITIGLNLSFKTNKGDFFILEEGKKIPDFTFQTLEGKNKSLYDYKGKIVLIHFWASWCAPCVVEFPELIQYAKNNPYSIVLAISSDMTQAHIERFLDRHASDTPGNFVIIHDKKQPVTRDKFSVFALPETFVMNEDGILSNHIVGAYDGWADF